MKNTTFCHEVVHLFIYPINGFPPAICISFLSVFTSDSQGLFLVKNYCFCLLFLSKESSICSYSHPRSVAINRLVYKSRSNPSAIFLTQISAFAPSFPHIPSSPITATDSPAIWHISRSFLPFPMQTQ